MAYNNNKEEIVNCTGLCVVDQWLLRCKSLLILPEFVCFSDVFVFACEAF